VGTFGRFGVFRCGEVPVEAIEEPVENQALAWVEAGVCESLQESGLAEDTVEDDGGRLDGAIKAGEEPRRR